MPAAPSLSFRPATTTDAPRIAALINAAYRGIAGEPGWTHEAKLFDGPRTDVAALTALIGTENSLILLCMIGPEPAGSVHLKKIGDGAYLGLLAVDPALQTAGIGKRILEESERVVRDRWGCRKISMTVIALRRELIEFYERRDYRKTGKVEPLPMENRSSPRAGTPKVPLELVWLEKSLV